MFFDDFCSLVHLNKKSNNVNAVLTYRTRVVVSLCCSLESAFTHSSAICLPAINFLLVSRISLLLVVESSTSLLITAKSSSNIKLQLIESALRIA